MVPLVVSQEKKAASSAVEVCEGADMIAVGAWESAGARQSD